MNDLKNKLKIYIDNNLIDEKPRKNGFVSKIKCLYMEECCEEDFESIESSYNAKEMCSSDSSNIQVFIDQHEKFNDFQTMLFKLIDERNLKDSDVYNKVHMDRRLFSKIRNNDYHPSKETIILLGIALELNEKEIDELLESASYSLPKNNHYDLIIRFCFINKIFKLDDINELLDKYHCKLFSY